MVPVLIALCYDEAMEDKVAVVTGASYGIGESIADALLKQGWKVYGLSRTKPKLNVSQFIWLQCDLSKPEQIESTLKLVTESEIGALVSNAGVIEIEKASAVSQSSYERTFSVNVLAPMLLVNALRDKIQSATIVSISSVSDRIPEAEVALYASSKAANTLYFNSLASELKNAKVYTLLPDYVDTPMQHALSDGNPDFDWSSNLKASDIARMTVDLVSGQRELESGANVIMVTEKLKDDLQSVEKLYGYNTDTKELTRLNPPNVS